MPGRTYEKVLKRRFPVQNTVDVFYMAGGNTPYTEMDPTIRALYNLDSEKPVPLRLVGESEIHLSRAV